MILTKPVGRNYRVGDELKFFTYMDTVSDDKRDATMARLKELGFDVRCEKSRSKTNPGWNLFTHTESNWDYHHKDVSWKVRNK